ncbi:MAG: hypothetical protein NTW38_02050 [Candidatus Aminicenantes bacterium]|nr:hypothetical protein [Candidatus Aminicenantes bacterium]
MKIFARMFLWQILFWVISLLLLAIFIPTSPRKISDIVQAQAVISLVLITWYYAIQTKKLVNEQIRFRSDTKRKIEVDFLEKRIDDFFHPLWVDLNLIHDSLYTNTISTQKETEQLEINLRSLYFKKRYMTKIDNNIYIDLLNTILLLGIDNHNDFAGSVNKRSEYEKKWKAFITIFNGEWNSIEKAIFLYYMPNDIVEAGAAG